MTPVIFTLEITPYSMVTVEISQIDGENVDEFDLKEALALWDYVSSIAEGQMDALAGLLAIEGETDGTLN